jgi:hypothetical protein
MSDTPTSNANRHHASPHLGLVAIIFTVLFLAGLYPVTVFGGLPYFPGPWEAPDVIANFFRAKPGAVLACAFFHFGAAIVLGIFTASIVSRLQFLGVRAAGVFIALFGGLATALDMVAEASILSVMTRPGVVENGGLILALYHLQIAFGGVGFSAPLGLLFGGVSIPAAFMRLLPKWVIGLGLLLFAIGELSSLNIISSPALFLIPLTRFPGFIWLIAAGFLIPSTAGARARPSAIQATHGTR